MSDDKPSVEYDTENLPETLPILPLYDAALFPKMVLPLVVMEGNSIDPDGLDNDRQVAGRLSIKNGTD